MLQHHRGETDDQLYVWVPGRRALASADYYQGFLPNAGNGKRTQRYVEDWATALREMAAQGEMIIDLAGGDVQAIADYARDLISRDIRLASHLTDWLFYARPDDSAAQQLVYDVYRARIMDPDTNTMEMLTFLDQMTAARERARHR